MRQRRAALSSWAIAICRLMSRAPAPRLARPRRDQCGHGKARAEAANTPRRFFTFAATHRDRDNRHNLLQSLFRFRQIPARSPPRGSILFEKGDALGAHDAFVDALFNIPADLEEAKAKQAKAQLESQIGVCLVSLGRRADAAKRFENALDIDPDHTQARRLLSVQQRILAPGRVGCHEQPQGGPARCGTRDATARH